jgi:hypothetical protein
MRKALRLLKWIVLGVLAALLIGFIVCWLMIQAKPAEFIQDFQAFGEQNIREWANECYGSIGAVRNKLQGGEPIREGSYSQRFTDRQINAALHQYERAGELRLPEGISHLQAAIKPDRLLLMAKLTYGPLETVLTSELRLALDAEGRLSLTAVSFRAGVMPVPDAVRQWLLDQLDARIARLAEKSPHRGAEAQGVAEKLAWLHALRSLLAFGRVNTTELPELPQDRCRLTGIRLEEGQATITLKPVPDAGR